MGIIIFLLIFAVYKKIYNIMILEGIRKEIMNKVIYFDEIAATDYVDIKNGGRRSIDKESLKKLDSQINADAEIKTPSGIFQQLLNFGLKASAEASAISNNIIKTYISNTILTDFLDTIKDKKKNKDIVIFTNPILEAYPNSMAFLKMYAPYMKMLNFRDLPINLGEIDSIITDAKGYYELVATTDNKRIILRFNIAAFRNNYALYDMLMMDLTFYAIRVGSHPENKLDISNMFPSSESEEPNAYDIAKLNKATTEEQSIAVYDVILAGVKDGIK